MKKLVLFIILLNVLVFASCSKESSFNRKLEGEWKTLTVDDTAMVESDGDAYVFKFEKDKNGGKITLYNTSQFTTDVFTGTYTLTDDKSITMIITYDDGTSDEDVLLVKDYTRKKMTLDIGGSIWVLEKKK